MSTPTVEFPAGLPAIDAQAREHMLHVAAAMQERIRQANGTLPFEQWMQIALYEPALGYYTAGSQKFHAAGDFTTAPETTPLFGQTLARQAKQILELAESDTLLEFGAGSGALATALLPALQQLGMHVRYQILELSPELRQRQQQRLAPWADQLQWLDTLPEHFAGCVLANEVLDAMPVTLFQWGEDGQLELLGVALDTASEAAHMFRWQLYEAPDEIAGIVASRMPPLPGYRSEINLQAEAWIREMGRWLDRGAALLIDYGFPRREYYHPQRMQGTLMCHLRHHAHDQALIYPGLQDITAHVDFTAMADAALEAGLDVLGYTSQARFLLNAGLLDWLHAPPDDAGEQARQTAAVNTLLSEAEMGELFKVMAIGRDVHAPLLGFARGDRRDRLEP